MTNSATNIILIVLAIVGAIALISLLSMWLMHGMMMGGGMMGLLSFVLIATLVTGLIGGSRSRPHP
jgi:hypothetical protein